jgi:hypothetical protein
MAYHEDAAPAMDWSTMAAPIAATQGWRPQAAPARPDPHEADWAGARFSEAGPAEHSAPSRELFRAALQDAQAFTADRNGCASVTAPGYAKRTPAGPPGLSSTSRHWSRRWKLLRDGRCHEAGWCSRLSGASPDDRHHLDASPDLAKRPGGCDHRAARVDRPPWPVRAAWASSPSRGGRSASAAMSMLPAHRELSAVELSWPAGRMLIKAPWCGYAQRRIVINGIARSRS